MRPGWMDISQGMWICQVGGEEQEDCDASNDGSEDDWSGQDSWSGGEGGVEKMKRRKRRKISGAHVSSRDICIPSRIASLPCQSRRKNEISIRSRYRGDAVRDHESCQSLSPLHSQGGPLVDPFPHACFLPFLLSAIVRIIPIKEKADRKLKGRKKEKNAAAMISTIRSFQRHLLI